MINSWNQRKIILVEDLLTNLKGHLPTFKREPWLNNDYLDVITKEPNTKDSKTVPVATVSKTYSFVQHTDVLELLLQAAKHAKLDLSTAKGKLILTEYGELMKLSIPLSNEQVVPPDKVPIIKQIVCTNSVNQSSPLEVNLSWSREGQEFLFSQDDSLKLNGNKVSSKEIESFLSTSLTSSSNILRTINETFHLKLVKDTEKWLKKEVTKKWGAKLTSQLKEMIDKGIDSSTTANTLKLKPDSVGGKIENLYHLYMALIWIANNQTEVEVQFEKIREVDVLFKSYIEMCKVKLLYFSV